MNLQALADFNLVALHGSLGRASRIAGRPKATLSRKIAELEQSLGVRLVDRGAGALRLTEDGRALHERTSGLLAEIAEAGEAAASGAPVPRGRLRISAPIVFASVALPRIAVGFAKEYPEVQLEIAAEDRIVHPVEDGYDLVIRVDPADDHNLVGRRILDDERWLVASPALARPGGQRAGLPHQVPAVMLPTGSADTIWRVRAAGGVERFRPAPILRLSSLLMVRDAVLADGGIAMLPRLLVADDVAAGRLTCWGVDDHPPVALWALYSSRRLLSAKVRAFLDLLVDGLRERSSAPQP